MPKIIFIEKSGNRREVVAETGQTLLQVAWANGLDVEGACEGNMACSTCHLIVDKAWAGKLPAPSVDETDMLDLAYGVTGTSRLGCQIKVRPELDGLVVALPPMTRSMLG
ncbi:MAG: 2Fe-2S iron-sulfur cluster binding domain-containing protein [Alphaproteobacteria bacterium]|nr:2Fe-2S iron-sulfur cluster binding domain-containing protein [Alphaproteobacteria bacterium]